MSRATQKDFPGAFRIVIEFPWGVTYVGPFQTKAAAKGQLTARTKYNTKTNGWIEKTPDGQWERVE